MMFLIKTEFILCLSAFFNLITTAVKQLKDNLELSSQYFPTYTQTKCTSIMQTRIMQVHVRAKDMHV